MATYSHTTLPLLLLFLITLTLFRSSKAAGIAVYWGQDVNEGSLADTCNTGKYQYVNIGFLTSFDEGQYVLDLGGHCNATEGGCTSLSNDIKICQSRGIKVLLSIGGPWGTIDANAEQDAANAGISLWNQYLGGSSDDRPLGDAVLDGIDFYVRTGYYWNVVANTLKAIPSAKKVYLSAAQPCFMGDVVVSPSFLDFMWVRFYNYPICNYNGITVANLLVSWNLWTSQTVYKIFMGLPADPAAAETGYIPPNVLKSQVLPVIKASNKYGGVMLWNRFYDHNYSSAILPNI